MLNYANRLQEERASLLFLSSQHEVMLHAGTNL